MSTFGERLKIARNKKKLTGEQIANLLGSGSKQTVSSWEKNRTYPETGTIIKLSNILGVTIDWLLTGENTKTYELPEGKALIATEEYMEYLKYKTEKLETENKRLREAPERISS